MKGFYRPYGDFGAIAEIYDQHRYPYDTSVFRDIFSQMYFSPEEGQREFRFLDIGCGTGHSTFALAQAAAVHLPTGSTYKIIGIDVDPRMIHKAMQNNKDTSRIVFMTSNINENLNIGRNFDMILCASAFYWISKDEDAIKRTYLLLRGSFNEGKSEKFPFVILDRDIMSPSDLKERIREYASESLGYSIDAPPNIKKEYYPSQILSDNKFVRIISILAKEVKSKTTPEQLARYATSISLWNYIPQEKQEDVYTRFLAEMELCAQNKVVDMKEWYSIVVGYRQR